MNALTGAMNESEPDVCQYLLFDKKGSLLQTCDSIFNTAPLKNTSLKDWFPLLESVFPLILDLEEGASLIYKKVHAPAQFLPGFYDFKFKSISQDHKDQFIWQVYNYTQKYEGHLQFQQKKNEMELEKQKKTWKSKN